MPESPTFLFFPGACESDRAFRRLRWRLHELLQNIEHDFKLLVVRLLHRGEPFSKLLMCCEDLTESHKRAHDGNVHGDRATALQDRGKHGDALLRKNVGQVAPATIART